MEALTASARWRIGNRKYHQTGRWSDGVKVIGEETLGRQAPVHLVVVVAYRKSAGATGVVGWCIPANAKYRIVALEL